MTPDNRNTTQIILDESKKLQGILNDHFLKEFAKFHNINPEHNGFELKQEVVAKKAYFLNVKKKYALYIVNEEGVDVSKMDVKGLITRRSDYPKVTKEGINKVLEMLVKDDKVSFTKIREFVEEKRKEILDLIIKGDKRIARPVSFTKTLDNYKVIPSHVHGMLLWNNVAYDYFVPGTKGYQFKINGVDHYNCPKEVESKLHYFNEKRNKIAVIKYFY